MGNNHANVNQRRNEKSWNKGKYSTSLGLTVNKSNLIKTIGAGILKTESHLKERKTKKTKKEET